jgi:hypothetical protein
MSKKLTAKTVVLFLSCGGVSQAHPLDSPDIVYIDGLPCNTACQSYMKWSRQQTSPGTAPARDSSEAVRRTSVKHRQSPGALPPTHAARQVAAIPPTRVAEPAPAAGKPEADSELAHTSTTASSPANGAATRTRTLREQVAAATTLAEQVTMAAPGPASSQELNGADRVKSAQPRDSELTPTISSNAEDSMVALVMTRLDVKSVAELAGKDVAIDEPQSASIGVVRNAIAAAGAAEVQLSPGQTKAIDRLIDGKVPAAVLTLVSKEAGEWFPDIAGFRVFRVPLSHRKLDQ